MGYPGRIGDDLTVRTVEASIIRSVLSELEFALGPLDRERERPLFQ